jgi:hypothetical protein
MQENSKTHESKPSPVPIEFFDYLLVNGYQEHRAEDGKPTKTRYFIKFPKRVVITEDEIQCQVYDLGQPDQARPGFTTYTTFKIHPSPKGTFEIDMYKWIQILDVMGAVSVKDFFVLVTEYRSRSAHEMFRAILRTVRDLAS